jgi:hypothetical protein
MAAHRYWRARFESPKSLHLSEFQLLAGVTRVDASATLTSNVAPASGALANLYDDDTSTGAVWPLARAVQLVWDFGGGTSDVSDIRLGSTLNRVGFPAVVYTDWSDDGTTWTFADTFGSIVWPGYRAKTASEQLGNFLHATPMTSPSGSPPPVISSSPTVLLVDNNGLFLPYRSPNAGAIVQVEFGRASLAASGLGMYAGLTTRRAIDIHRTNSTSVVNSAQSWIYDMNGQKRSNGTGVAYGATWTTGDVIGATFNTSTGAITFYKNGVTQGAAYTVVPGDFPDLTAFILAAGSSGQLNGSNSFLRTRGFTYPIAGAVPWEDRMRIVTTMPTVSAPGAFYGALATLAARTSFALAGIKGPYRLARDFRDPILGTGNGRVRGQTLEYALPSDKPYPCLVRLVREIDGLQIREAWSAADGSYDFQYLDELQSYTVLAYYLAHGKRALIGDGLTLANGKVELMP